VIESVLAVAAYEKIYVAIVVKISAAYTLSPAAANESCFLGDVSKLPVASVAEEAVCGIEIWRQAVKASSIDQENVQPAVIVIINEGGPASGSFQEVTVSMLITVGHTYVETSLLRHICKPYSQVFIPLCLAGQSGAGKHQANKDRPAPNRDQRGQIKTSQQNIAALPKSECIFKLIITGRGGVKQAALTTDYTDFVNQSV
jgi:hypothetical protein